MLRGIASEVVYGHDCQLCVILLMVRIVVEPAKGTSLRPALCKRGGPVTRR
jgi:hypothetical protein